jgi:tRNA-(ms[2]io[6]A)-hydroxylase
LFESEARHHTTYVKLAENFTGGNRQIVRQRLDELSAAETEIITEGSPLARMHS